MMKDDETATLVLDREFIACHVPPSAYLAAVEDAFRRLARRELDVPAVGHVPGVDGGFHIKAAVSRRAPRHAAIKVNGNFPDNDARRGLPTIHGFIALLDAECGRVLALMDSTEITARRTAATSALAAQRLARSDARRLALIGCGKQARHHLDAFEGIFPLTDVALFDRVAERAHELAAVAAAKGLAAAVATSPAAACAAADIIVTCTPSRTPLFAAHDVRAGTFIAAVGADNPDKQELSVDLLRRARVVPDILTQAIHMGDLHHAIAAGIMTAGQIHGELADVVAGMTPGRQTSDEIFVFDSTGAAITDLAAADVVYAQAQREGTAPRFRLNG